MQRKRSAEHPVDNAKAFFHLVVCTFLDSQFIEFVCDECFADRRFLKAALRVKGYVFSQPVNVANMIYILVKQ